MDYIALGCMTGTSLDGIDCSLVKTDGATYLNDIANVVRIIDVASQRGAFRGPELSQVGTVHDRLMKFLEANQPKPAEDGKPKAADDESKGQDEVDKLD